MEYVVLQPFLLVINGNFKCVSPWCRVDSHHKLSGEKKKKRKKNHFRTDRGESLLVRKTSPLPCLRSYSDKFKQICRTQCYKLLKHQWRSSPQEKRTNPLEINLHFIGFATDICAGENLRHVIHVL